MQRLVLFLGLLTVLMSCNKFEYDPNQSVSLNSADRVNYESLRRLQLKPYSKKITFAVTGDTHLDYDNTIRLVNKVNTDNEIDFLVHLGDITDHGLLQEFNWCNDILAKLNVPYITVIGNHDLVAKGSDVYKLMYGPTDFSFILDSVKFIVFNSNSREYDFSGKVPDLSFISKELALDKKVNHYVLLSHVPYWDKDYDHALRNGYLDIINEGPSAAQILASFNGHLHNPGIHQTNETVVPHFIPGSVNKRTYLKVTIENAQLTYEKITF